MDQSGPIPVATADASGWRAPQQRDGMALVLSSALSSGVGLLYWVLAARLFAPAVVGVNATLVSTLTLLGSAAQLNLGSALLRFVPVAGRRARVLVASCYAVGIGMACLTGLVFGLGARWWAPDLLGPVGQTGLVVFFTLATPVWSLFVMQDYVLTAIKKATVVPLENLVFAVLKIGLLIGGGLLAAYGAIAGSWTLATAVIVVAITVYLLRAVRRHGEAGTAVAVPVGARTVAGFVAADWAGTLCTLSVNFGLPLLVLARLGAEPAATYNVAWQVAFALYLVSNGMGQSMVAHASGHLDGLAAARRTMITKSLTLVLPAAVVLVPGSYLVLWIFGQHYADTGATFLSLAAVSAVPNVLNIATVNAARVRGRRIVQFGVPAAIAAIVIPMSWWLMPGYGLTGVGVTWLVAQSVVAAVILVHRIAARPRGAAAPPGDDALPDLP